MFCKNKSFWQRFTCKALWDLLLLKSIPEGISSKPTALCTLDAPLILITIRNKGCALCSFSNIFGFCFCKNVGIKSRPDLKSLFPQFFYARELFMYVCSTSKFKQKRYKNIYLAHGIPATSSETTNPEFFCSKICWFTFFFREKLQIVFLCKLNIFCLF